MNEPRNLGIVLLILLLFAVPTLQIFSALREFHDVGLRIESFQKGPQTLLNRSLLEKRASELPKIILNLFAANPLPPEPAPAKEIKPNVSSAPLVSLSDLMNHFRESMAEKLETVKIPDIPKPDFSKMQFRGFFRKNKVNKAIVLLNNNKLVLVSRNQKISEDFLLEECDFFQEIIRVKYLPIGSVHEIRVERPGQ